MKGRIQIDTLEPNAYKGMYALESYLKSSGLNSTHKHLIYLRASQLNGCAYCIDMHTKEALKDGEVQQRLFLLDAWWETDLFDEKEKLIIEITEEITMIHEKGLTDNTYQRAIAHFGETYVAQIIMAVVTINGWNRISISTPKPIVKAKSIHNVHTV
jgi:AhpD family alkylhydroperoxidase